MRIRDWHDEICRVAACPTIIISLGQGPPYESWMQELEFAIHNKTEAFDTRIKHPGKLKPIVL